MRLFGTDGVRGLANGETLTASLALDLAVSAARVLTAAGDFSDHRPRAVVGRDPRVSGQFIEAAVTAGLASAGVDVLHLGVVPTPGIAYLTNSLNADLGVVITASHNPMADNGIKFLARGGVKLDDSLEDAIESRLGEKWSPPTGADVGRVGAYHGAIDDYVDHLLTTISTPLAGLRFVLDCAHGAAFESAPLAFERAGAEVIALHNQPDGLNINDGVGSTHMDALRKAVVEHGADAGFAFDGDADRCLAVDHEGELVDGDQILGILATALRDAGRLANQTLVATVMSNIGLHQAMKAAGIAVRTTAVGDRYVLEEMKAGGFTLGGEQSGHVIMSQFATTGDGALTALHMAEYMAITGRSLSQLASAVVRSPQVLVNVAGVDRSRCDADPGVADAVRHAAALLGDGGRVLLRPSGTEPVVRVMVEAPTAHQASEVAHSLAEIVRERLAL